VRVRDYFIAAGARLAVAVAGRDVVRMLARELARIESPSHLVGETLHTFPRRSPLARHAHRPTASTSSWLSERGGKAARLAARASHVSLIPSPGQKSMLGTMPGRRVAAGGRPGTVWYTSYWRRCYVG